MALTQKVKVKMTETVHHEWDVEIPADFDITEDSGTEIYQYLLDNDEIDFSDGESGGSEITITKE